MRTSGRGGEGQKYALTADEDSADFWGFAHEAEGLFTAPQEEGLRRVQLTGCAPQGSLLRCLGHAGGRRAVAGNAWLDLLDADGVPMGSYFVNDVTVVAVRPSARGAGLVDLTVTLWCEQATPGAAGVWELLRTGRLNRPGMWHVLDSADRRAWLSVALWSWEYRQRGRADAPAGRVFTLDGRHVIDADSFYCALGEAINGPGGYFGWNLDALADCLSGGWGATPPFTLYWQDSAVARAALGERRATSGGAASLFEVLLEIFEEQGVRVILR